MNTTQSYNLDANVIFCIWTGLNPMSANRIQAFYSILTNSGCPVAFITHNNVKQWERKNFPFHSAFELLSETHKADYLRAYLMHHYGGGYTDIKHTHKNWLPFFSEFKESDMLCAGYTELSSNSVAPVGGEEQIVLSRNFHMLIGLCSFIFRPQSELTSSWIENTHSLLDEKIDELFKNPSQHPQDRRGVILPNGEISKYPLQWTELLGNIFHPLIYMNSKKVMHLPLAPDFSNYR